jgi:Ca-activated chloride channel family protein
MLSSVHMNRALAASIAAVMIGAPAAFHLWRVNAPGEGARPTAALTPRQQNEASAPAPAPVLADARREAPNNRLAKSRDASPSSSAPARAEKDRFAAPSALRMLEAAGVPDANDPSLPAGKAEGRDRFEAADVNPVKAVTAEPVSTFSIDVDTASYAFARRALNEGRLPPKDSVRVEEFVNYFPYNSPQPESADVPFKPTITVAPSPWNAQNRLVHIAVQGYSLQGAQRPRANLVFLVDVSGSMAPEDRLPLVKNALRMLVDELKPEDTVALVTYASGSGVALEPTRIAEKGKIVAAIDALGAGGSTAGAQGIQDAYRLAEANFDKAAVNRVILATDGDFNVGVTDQRELKGLIERKRDKGVFLSILGVGRGNYNDALMQALAQNGNGTAAYVDTLTEARKVLVEEASSTLFPIAKDVKIQVEWNPARVSEYRLIGYETRALRREDFNNDRVDAGDVGSGHRVTAIYEITPVGGKKLVDDLRYGKKAAETSATADGELGFFKLRYKLPREQESKLISSPIGEAQAVERISNAPEDIRFSIAVAAFGQLLKGAPYLGNFGYDDAIALAQGAKGADPFGYRAELVNLVRLAKTARP